jgi:LemA protein
MMWMWLVIGALVLAVGWAVWAYNRLVTQRNRVQNAWSQIEVQLKRRYDLIPNLVETVKGYATHERGVLERVTEARAAAVAAGTVGERAAAEGTLTQALRSLFAVAEAYPDLKANQNFLSLQDELSQTESKIAYARQFYNDTVMSYNTLRETFPTNLIAGPAGFEAREYFEVEEAAAREPVKVDFTTA